MKDREIVLRRRIECQNQLSAIRFMPLHFRDGAISLSSLPYGDEDQESNAIHYEKLIAKLEAHIARLDSLLTA